MHDYRVIDYRGPDGKYRTLFIDPNDRGNQLLYYNTDDPSSPSLERVLQATWEADEDGLGQVRPGGP
eukprot:CAMPEP_0195087474 /NCGR_PEP_ID=MMETSP0448-20130528/27304_1 /TAXON_ID=66468 /ORGANISM="Heterocapsa triquestra, Strain CCMP 448" /LENGTH=66 /DNA_ID=CAMNT_0040121041 /DNA_START=1 /DNA_END=198 /DNA_ORIENTATION=-